MLVSSGQGTLTSISITSPLESVLHVGTYRFVLALHIMTQNIIQRTSYQINSAQLTHHLPPYANKSAAAVTGME